MTPSPEQNRDCGELDEALTVGQELVASGDDAAELLELAEEVLDEIALLVEELFMRPRLLEVRLGRGERLCSGIAGGPVQVVSGIPLVGLASVSSAERC